MSVFVCACALRWIKGPREDKCISKDVNACFVSFFFPAAKPLHHHGQECLRLKVDVIAADGKFLTTLLDERKAVQSPLTVVF